MVGIPLIVKINIENTNVNILLELKIVFKSEILFKNLFYL
jgi:hypothetical protein